ncbi:ion channel POLLUX-like 2 [Pyrus ussuriensis x Pyrus communis]|uniref:Ion channel POLLUX-like 2 n=1 Tax=Pyrus ussuriensis x Pyrus communis TaxID=2448454 RepID=A0A5N5HEI3_9ROSA|nr:ion channel POLLUX-like 2 [Pyrus ussuriensis x Pyrus communis]
MKAKKELVDLNSKANEALYRASKQKTKATTSGERIPFLNFQLSQKRRDHIECYKHSGEENAKMKEERHKGFEDFRQVVKEKEPNQPQWDSITV